MYVVKSINDGIETTIHSEKEKLASGKIVKGVNTIDTFTFSVFPNNSCFDSLNEFTTGINAYNATKGKYDFHGRVLYTEDEMSQDGQISKQVTCESVFGYLCDSQQDYVETRNWTVNGLLTHLINCHNAQVEEYKQFKIGTVTAKDDNDNLYQGIQRESTWDAIKSKLIDKIGGELQYRVEDDGLYIDYLDKIGEEKETEIALSYNMKAITREKDPTSFVTRLIPLGAKLSDDTEERLDISSVNAGKKYIDDAEAIAKYGIHVGIQIFDGVTNASILLTKGRNWMTENNRIQVKYSITALDLSVIGLAYDDFEIGNSHPIKNGLLKIDDTARIIKQSIDICEEVKSSIEVGDNFKTLSEIQAEQQRVAAQNIATLEKTASDLESNVNKTQNDLNALTEKVENIKGLFFYIRYSANADGTGMTEKPQADTAYMGTCSTNSATAPTEKTAYTWCKILGEGGEQGVGVADMKAQYCISSSKTTEPTSGWVDAMPTWSIGTYLWIRHVVTYTDGSTETTTALCDSSWEAVNELDAKLDFEEVFNRLTKNGTLQGIYKDENGNVCINASYIKSGEFLADLIKAGVIKSKDGTSVVIDLDNGTVDLTGTLKTAKTLTATGYTKQAFINPDEMRIDVGDESGKHLGSYINEWLMRVWFGDDYQTTVSADDIAIESLTYPGTKIKASIDPDDTGSVAEILVSTAENNPLTIVSMDGNNYISGLSTPTEDSHATNKKYVDDLHKITDLTANLVPNANHVTSDGVALTVYKYGRECFVRGYVYIQNAISNGVSFITGLPAPLGGRVEAIMYADNSSECIHVAIGGSGQMVMKADSFEAEKNFYTSFSYLTAE